MIVYVFTLTDQHVNAIASSPIQETWAGAFRDLSQLPQTVPHFVSRDQECEAIKGYLCPTHNCRCVLLHGVTGVGKTSTAIKVANERLNSDSRTIVAYVNCRYITSLDDFSEKVLQQVYHYPVENPISELKYRLRSQDFYTILLLDNFEFLLHLDDSGQEMPNELQMVQERMNPSSEESKVMNFITEIVMISRKVKLLVTSSEKVVFPGLGQKTIQLTCFSPEESLQLLQRVCEDREVNQLCAYILSEICSGIPLVLYTLALSHHDLIGLVKEMSCSSPQEKFEFLENIQSVPKEEKINVCLDVCFGRLNTQEQNTLITLALLRGRFSLSRAAQVFHSTALSEHQLKLTTLELARRSLLEQNIVGGACLYTFLRVIREYCRSKAFSPNFRVVSVNARNMFIAHFLAFLDDTFKKFLSKNASDAITAFRQDEENVMQLIDWCENGEMNEEQITRCIDIFNSVGELLAKMIGKKRYESVFTLLRKKCEEMGDQRRLSECLTSLGIKQVFNCTCSPYLCDEAAERARKYLVEADRIQSYLGINDGNSRAQCLAKHGRCLAKEGKFLEGREKIQQAINIRQTRGEEDIVMLAATYNDMAVALSLEGDHQEAIVIRERQTLPIYRECLGDHPFTATILNNLSNNYYALGDYDSAKLYSEDALKMRLDLLKDHRDTAKSLFDLGMVHKERVEFQKAKDCFEKSEKMQMKVLDDNIKDLQR
ncbi:hypothetical protein ACROYT_G000351 [Oculina patagonica]